MLSKIKQTALRSSKEFWIVFLNCFLESVLQILCSRIKAWFLGVSLWNQSSRIRENMYMWSEVLFLFIHIHYFK